MICMLLLMHTGMKACKEPFRRCKSGECSEPRQLITRIGRRRMIGRRMRGRKRRRGDSSIGSQSQGSSSFGSQSQTEPPALLLSSRENSSSGSPSHETNSSGCLARHPPANSPAKNQASNPRRFPLGFPPFPPALTSQRPSLTRKRQAWCLLDRTCRPSVWSQASVWNQA